MAKSKAKTVATTLKDLLPSTGSKMTEQQVIKELIKMGIWDPKAKGVKVKDIRVLSEVEAAKTPEASWDYLSDGIPAFVLSVEGAEEQLGHIARDISDSGYDNYVWVVYPGPDGSSSEPADSFEDLSSAVEYLENFVKEEAPNLKITNKPNESDFGFDEEDHLHPDFEEKEVTSSYTAADYTNLIKEVEKLPVETLRKWAEEALGEDIGFDIPHQELVEIFVENNGEQAIDHMREGGKIADLFK